jgi:hypothetical protein
VSIDEYIYIYSNGSVDFYMQQKKCGVEKASSEKASERDSKKKKQQMGDGKVPKSKRAVEKGKWDVEQTQDKRCSLSNNATHHHNHRLSIRSHFGIHEYPS